MTLSDIAALLTGERLLAEDTRGRERPSDGECALMRLRRGRRAAVLHELWAD